MRGWWRTFSIGSVLLGMLACASPAPSASVGVPVTARSIAKPPELAPGRRLGELELVAALALRSADDRFGGLSGLLVEDDRLTAVSDRATLWTARLRHDPAGVLVGLDDWRVEAIGAYDRARRGSGPDTESLTRLADGSLVAAAETPARPLVLEGRMPAWLEAMEPALADLPVNEGVEAWATLPDGSVLALAEAVEGDGLHRALILGEGGTRELRYRAPDGFSPTGADVSGRQLIVLERRLSLLGGLEARIVTVDVDALRPGAVIEGRELARLGPGSIAENFEGIAAGPVADGTMLYVIADDNFNPLQRTVLLQLLWRQGQGRQAQERQDRAAAGRPAMRVRRRSSAGHRRFAAAAAPDRPAARPRRP